MLDMCLAPRGVCSYFSWFPGTIMVPDIDYPNKQAELLQFEENLKSVAHVTLVPRSWLRELTDWVAATSGLDSNVRSLGDAPCTAAIVRA